MGFAEPCAFGLFIVEQSWDDGCHFRFKASGSHLPNVSQQGHCCYRYRPQLQLGSSRKSFYRGVCFSSAWKSRNCVEGRLGPKQSQQICYLCYYWFWDQSTFIDTIDHSFRECKSTCHQRQQSVLDFDAREPSSSKKRVEGCITGFSRLARSEHPVLQTATLDIEDDIAAERLRH